MKPFEHGAIAVIFISRRGGGDPEGYARADEEMNSAVRKARGYLGHDSISTAEGRGITISYWTDREAVAEWREEARHASVREEGRRSWYDHYRLIVTTIERSHEWSR
jgi:heme-degrading monooxygenase HmoA